MAHLHPVDKHLLFTKNDPQDPRLGECVLSLAKNIEPNFAESDYDIAVLGYPDDEGISNNGGRPGAQNAPREIRQAFYKLTPHPLAPHLPKILDLGDLTDREVSLEERHQKGRALTASLAKAGRPWIGLGGGHDYGYVDGAGFLDQHGKDAVILNFDAHLDVRPLDKGIHSGNAFFRLLSEYPKQFDFAEFGIQNHCNSKFHLQWAQDQGAKIFSLDEIEKNGLLETVKSYLSDKKDRKIFLSLDMDAFSSTEAPGCSQSWTTGLKAKEFLPVLEWIVQNYDVRALGLYEVSPPLDFDNQTSKLAALVLHRFLFAHLNKISAKAQK